MRYGRVQKKSFLKFLFTSLIIIFSAATHSQPYGAGRLDRIVGDPPAVPKPPPERKSAEEIRRSEIKATSFDLRKSDYTVYLRVLGESIGTVDITQLGPDNTKKTGQEVSQVRSVLQENKALVGDASKYEFEIINQIKGEIGAKIFFRQKIGDVLGPRCWLFTDGDGKVKDFFVQLIDPSNPDFNKSNWLSETQLVAIAKSAYESQYGKFSEDEIDSTHFDTISESDGTTVKPVMVIHHRHHQIDVNVLTGEVENVRSMRSGQSEDVYAFLRVTGMTAATQEWWYFGVRPMDALIIIPIVESQ